jgi:hypothetical protein
MHHVDVYYDIQQPKQELYCIRSSVYEFLLTMSLVRLYDSFININSPQKGPLRTCASSVVSLNISQYPVWSTRTVTLQGHD